MQNSGVATGGGAWGQSATPDSKKIDKNREKKRGKIRKNWEKRGKIGKKRQKSGRFFHFALLTDRAGYATDAKCIIFSQQIKIL